MLTAALLKDCKATGTTTGHTTKTLHTDMGSSTDLATAYTTFAHCAAAWPLGGVRFVPCVKFKLK